MQAIHMHHTNRVRPFIIADGRQVVCQQCDLAELDCCFWFRFKQMGNDQRKRNSVPVAAGRETDLGPGFEEMRRQATFDDSRTPQPDARLTNARQEALAARAACWLAICSFIFFCIS
jgi:hypothetical protein